jgi:3-deoxy-D-manno-octulosonate 8-phosphate phosphatase (KDO 8-P phosphatase)
VSEAAAGPPPGAGTAPPADDLDARLRRVKLVVLDVDGVLTDGRIIIDDHGIEQKHFHVLDGSGVWLLRRAGIETAIISGRYSACVTVRARELLIAQCHQASRDKVVSFGEVARHHGVEPAEAAYMGDDILDIPLMRRVGLAAAPRNARPEVKAAAQLVTEAEGGHGAVRELAERILKAQGHYQRLLREVYGVEG